MVSPGRTPLMVRVWPTWMEYSDITEAGTLLAGLFAPPLPQAEAPSTPTASNAAYARRFMSGKRTALSGERHAFVPEQTRLGQYSGMSSDANPR